MFIINILILLKLQKILFLRSIRYTVNMKIPSKPITY